MGPQDVLRRWPNAAPIGRVRRVCGAELEFEPFGRDENTGQVTGIGPDYWAVAGCDRNRPNEWRSGPRGGGGVVESVTWVAGEESRCTARLAFGINWTTAIPAVVPGDFLYAFPYDDAVRAPDTGRTTLTCANGPSAGTEIRASGNAEAAKEISRIKAEARAEAIADLTSCREGYDPNPAVRLRSLERVKASVRADLLKDDGGEVVNVLRANMENLVECEARYRRDANRLSDECGALKSENTALLSENARLRRALERKR